MSDDVNKTDAAGGDSFNLFIPITKIDEEKREVYGVGAVEIADHSNQIFDYATSKPRIQKWSQDTQARSQGKSLGNVREMHKASAAGKVIRIDFDDTGKRVLLGSKIVDDAAWNKVKEGVYTGYSIGGNYANIWPDGNDFGKMRYTAEPTEWSLVDAPCIPGSNFTVVKADGEEERLFKGLATGETLLIEKAIPEAPEPLAAIPLDVIGAAKITASNTPQINPISTSVERQPDPARLMPLDPDSPPTGETLAAHNDTAKSLEADFNKFLTVFEAKINKVVSDAIEGKLASYLQLETPSAPAERQMIKVRGGGTRKIAVRHSVGLIKVNRKGDLQ